MGLAEFEWKRDEKINGVIYDMSPRPNYQHGVINGNIYRIIGNNLKIVCVLYLWKILTSIIIQMSMMIMFVRTL